MGIIRSMLRLNIAVALTGSLWAQESSMLLEQGQPIVGVGRAEVFRNVLINNNGLWVSTVETDGPPSRNYTIVRFGFPALTEEDSVAEPSGAIVRISGSANTLDTRLDDDGNLLWQLEIAGPTVGGSNNQGIYWNTRLLAREGFPVGAPELPLGTTWVAFRQFDFTASNTILLAGTADTTPDAGGPLEDIIVQIDFDEFGTPQQPRTLLAPGDPLPTDGSLETTFKRIHPMNGFRSLNANGKGEFIWAARTDQGVHYMMIGTDRVIASSDEVFDSPEPNLDGRSFESFVNVEADLNDFGDYAFSATLNEGNAALEQSSGVLIFNGNKYVQEGERLQALNGATIGDPSEAPVYISNSRDLYWMANLRETLGTENRAYMRNRTVILRKGLSHVGDSLVTEIPDTENAFHVSPDGRFWIGQTSLAGRRAITMVDFGLAVELPGCFGNEGRLRVVKGLAVVGQALTLGFSEGQTPGVLTFFALSPNLAGSQPGCGLPTAFGELFLGTPVVLSVPGPPHVGGTAPLLLGIPKRLELVDSEWFGQGFFLDTGSGATLNIRLTNALRFVLGAP